MSAPRRPRGEKPTNTIRWQRRQMIQMEQIIGALRLACDDKDKVIAGFDVQMSEQDDQIRSLQDRNADQAAGLGWFQNELRMSAKRLAYLEGYFYAKEKEAQNNPSFAPIRATGPFVSRNTAQVDSRSGPRDPEGLQVRRPDAEGPRYQEGTERHGPAAGDPAWGIQRDDRPHQKRRPVEHIEITEIGSDHEYGATYWMKS